MHLENTQHLIVECVCAMQSDADNIAILCIKVLEQKGLIEKEYGASIRTGL